MDLRGRRLLLTRAAADSASWARSLEERGIEPVVLPCIFAEPVPAHEVRAAVWAAE